MADDLISVTEARRRIAAALKPLAPIDLPLAEAYGCVSASDVTAEYDIPAFSSASTPGVAARSADLHGASPESPVVLRVAGRVVAGRPPDVVVGWGECARIDPGAPMPAGTDCVMQAGRFTVEGQGVRITEPVPAGAAVNPAGEDVRAGTVLVPSGRRLSAGELGLLATAGRGDVLAYPRLRVAVASIGSSLVEPGRATGFGQLRDANSFLLVGALREIHAVPYRLPIVRDVEADLRETMLSNLSRADGFLVSGRTADEGGSEEVATVLAGLGDVQTYRTDLFPGGTFGFGFVEGQPFFELPADPTAALMAFEVFVRPAFLHLMGRRDLARPELPATLDQDVTGPVDRMLMVPARLEHRQGGWHAMPTGPADPRLLGPVVQGNGLVMISPGTTTVEAGSPVTVQVLRPGGE